MTREHARRLRRRAEPDDREAVVAVVGHGVLDEVEDELLEQVRVAAHGVRLRVAATAGPRPARPRARRRSTTRRAAPARSTGSSLASAPASLRASASRLSSSASKRSTSSRTTTAVVRSSPAVASGSASATSTSVRSTVSGVRSSCDAFATKRFWLREGRVEALEHRVERVRQLVQLVVGPLEPDPAAERLARDGARRRRDRAHRAERAVRDEPPEQHGDDVTARSATTYWPAQVAQHVVGNRVVERVVQVPVQQRVAHGEQQPAGQEDEQRVEGGETQPDGRPRPHQIR